MFRATLEYMRREFAIATPKPKRWPLMAALLVAALYLVWFANLSTITEAAYANSVARAKSASVEYTQLIGLGTGLPPLKVLKDDPFGTESRWIYVSKWHSIPSTYVPSNLVSITVAHAASAQPFQLTSMASEGLTKLFAAGQEAGYPLVVSSAYRSASDQQLLRKQTITERGQAYADEYIALPGTSEHQTGLAVDINTYSSACVVDATTCTLTTSTAAWLEAHAPAYGFILRYPKDKAALTGISGESWHFRYIGSEATTITKSGLVYDEVVRKVEPEWFK